MAKADGQRQLAAIMFTDMVGYASAAQKNESLAVELLEEQRRILRSVLPRYDGEEIKTIGDGFLLEFASALQAAQCAVEIQRTIEKRNSSSSPQRRIQVRIGIHVGDVIRSRGDIVGDGVNIASRIEPLAEAGGICISRQVYDQIQNKLDQKISPLGAHRLKHIETPIEVYEITMEPRHPILERPKFSERNRVAILPVTNISPDPSDEYFADGMTEELISCVSKVRGLGVIARTSVMRYKGARKPIAEIARELGVGSVLEGSVRKAGNRVRITVQLVEASTEEPRWSEEYDKEVKDLFEVQSEIGQKVAEALKVHVLKGELKMIGRVATTSPEAYVQYLRGRQLWNKRTKNDLEEAVRRFEEALRIDPAYAKAYSGLADAYAMLASFATEYVPPDVAYPQALSSITKALELDPDLVEAHTSLGVVRCQYDWDWRGAEEEFRRAIELNPNYAPAHQFFSDCLKAIGRFDEALAEVRRAQELDPLSPAISAGVGHVLYLSRQYEKAIEQYKKAVELDPGFMQTHIWFGRPYLEMGMYQEAISELRVGARLSGESNVALAMLGHGLASAGQKEEAIQILKKLRERSKRQYVPSYWIAVIYNGMKDRDQVVAWLRKAFEERSSWLVWVNVEPRFQWLKGDSGFESIMKEMKFP